METIVWQTEYERLRESFHRGKLVDDARGGDSYEFQAAQYLAKKYRIVFDKYAVRRPGQSSLLYWSQLRRSNIENSFCIKSPSVVLHGQTRKNCFNICIIHHIYLKRKEGTLKGMLSNMLLPIKFRRLHTIVVPSHFWENYFTERGCEHVKVIYNSFDLAEFDISRNQTEMFLQSHNIPTEKPIIYIGMSEKTKGALETCKALKECDFTLVTTGSKKIDFELPVHHFYLERQDYLKLLKASDLVIAMSNVEEGWSRICHEAMLCKTPVIGSGLGGMRELLSGGGQVITKNFEDLPKLSSCVLKEKHEYGNRGYEYAKKFTVESFQAEWQKLVERGFETIKKFSYPSKIL